MLVLKLFNSVCETKWIRPIKYGYSCFKQVVKWTIFVLGPVNMEVGDPKVGEVTRLGGATRLPL